MEYPKKVLQFGAGNFLRAFFNYIVEVLHSDTDFKGSVVIIKPTPGGDYHDLVAQKGKFNILQEGFQGKELKSEIISIDNISLVINPYHDFKHFLQSARIPSIKIIVSNTTEAGIRFNDSNALIDRPAMEFPAKLTQWLFERFQHFKGHPDKGCYILPCELIADNGKELKKCILQYTRLWNLGTDFEYWIEHHNVFYNTLVDRIVSGYPQIRAKQIEKQIGTQDNLLVASENYLSWVIEGPRSILKELPFDQTCLNIKFVEDLKPYREIKVRILNGAHTALVPVAYLKGVDLVRTAMDDPLIRSFLEAVVYRDICPVIKMKKSEVERFAQSVFERFSNPYIDHELLSISLNSFSKFKTRLLPTLKDSIQGRNKIPSYLIFSLAALILFYKGRRNQEVIRLKDDPLVLDFMKEKWELFDQGALSYIGLCNLVLSNQTFWGADFNLLSQTSDLVSEHLQIMCEKGMERALEELLKTF